MNDECDALVLNNVNRALGLRFNQTRKVFII